MSFSLNYRLSDQPDFGWLASRLERPESLLRAFANYRESQFQSTVAAGVDPYGNAYAPLSAMYAIQKSRRSGSRAILTATGAMIRSYRVQVSGSRMTETVEHPAGYHQTGTSKMPKRTVLPDARGLPPKDEQTLIRLAIQQIDESIGQMPRI